MFDRITVAPQRGTTYVNKTVIEKRAPTDDSVKLLREMEAAAREQVLEAISVGDTAFQCVVHYQRLVMDDADELVAIFSLNGRKMEARFKQHSFRGGPRDLVAGLVKEIAKTITHEILDGALRKLTEHVLIGPMRGRRP